MPLPALRFSVCFLSTPNLSQSLSPRLHLRLLHALSLSVSLSHTDNPPLGSSMATPSPSPPPLDLRAVLTESKRIINAHSRHFLALSVLFLLPISFSLSVFPTLHHFFSHSPSLNSKILLFAYQDPSHTLSTIDTTLILSFTFYLFVFAFSLLATGSITYSVFHGFYGRPVKLVSAIKSALSSFFPLFITVFLAQILVFGILLLFGLILFSVFEAFHFVGFQLELGSPYFTGLCVVVFIGWLVVSVYLQLNWTLACVIVVVESSWGSEPFKRSKVLINGMRKVAFSLMLFFGLCIGLSLWIAYLISSIQVGVSPGGGGGWRSWGFVLQIVLTSAMMMVVFLYNVAAYAVLYMYCKAVHGELAWEIAKEFAREYVSLPFDDGKVPHLVSVFYS